MNKIWMKGAIIAGAMMSATPALAATQVTTLNLSATNYAASTATQNFAAGTYTVSLINGVYSAWARSGTAIPGTTPTQYNPTGNWTDYYKYTINGVDTIFNPLNFQAFATAAAAFNAYTAVGPLTLNFLTPTTVTFGISDDASSFGDNAGGISLAIAAVPESATWLMMIAGFGMIGFALRGAARSRGVVATA